MSKHKSEDYKLSAVKYYLNNNVSLDDVCEIFDCPKQSLYSNTRHLRINSHLYFLIIILLLIIRNLKKIII